MHLRLERSDQVAEENAGTQRASSLPSLEEGRSLAFKLRTTRTPDQNTWRRQLFDLILFDVMRYFNYM
jgi:hypothetical protein